MNRKFLEELGLEKESIDKIMAEHGRSINDLKASQEQLEGLQSEKTNLEKQVQELQGTLSANEEKLSNIDDLQNQIKSYELKDLKTQIALKSNIPLDLVDRLSGETEEEISADADKLAAFVNKKQAMPLKHTEPQKVDAKEQAYENLAKDLFN